MHTRSNAICIAAMNEARDYWNHYVETFADLAAVAAKLDTPYSTIAGICNGSRGIGRDLASRFAEQDPLLDASKLLWVTAEVKRSTKVRAA